MRESTKWLIMEILVKAIILLLTLLMLGAVIASTYIKYNKTDTKVTEQCSSH